MVDRYKSMLEQSQHSLKKSSLHMDLQLDPHRYDKLIQRTQHSAQRMKEHIRTYQSATTPEQERQIQENFRREQSNFRQARDRLAKQYSQIENDPSVKNQAMFVKEHLLKTVQQELSLDVKMNEVITARERQLQILTNTLQPGSQRLQNALNDIHERRNQIMYLEEQVKECVQLLQVIGILVFEQGEKIDMARQNIGKANKELEKALKKIDKAKERNERVIRRRCCIIILGLIIICLIVVFVFAVKLKWL